MLDKNPLEVIYRLHDTINRGDIETILTLFESEAIFVVGPRTFAVGTDGLRQTFEEILRSFPVLKTEKENVIEIGDIALVQLQMDVIRHVTRCIFHLAGGYAFAALHRQLDGRWLVKIDNPLGAEILG